MFLAPRTSWNGDEDIRKYPLPFTLSPPLISSSCLHRAASTSYCLPLCTRACSQILPHLHFKGILKKMWHLKNVTRSIKVAKNVISDVYFTSIIFPLNLCLAVTQGFIIYNLLQSTSKYTTPPHIQHKNLTIVCLQVFPAIFCCKSEIFCVCVTTCYGRTPRVCLKTASKRSFIGASQLLRTDPQSTHQLLLSWIWASDLRN